MNFTLEKVELIIYHPIKRIAAAFAVDLTVDGALYKVRLDVVQVGLCKLRCG
jgi:hypothetical protein